MDEIVRNEVTFEVLNVRLIKRTLPTPKEWYEIHVVSTDQYGSRNMIVHEGDVLKAIFDMEGNTCLRNQSLTPTSTTRKLPKIFSSIFRKPKS